MKSGMRRHNAIGNKGYMFNGQGSKATWGSRGAFMLLKNVSRNKSKICEK